MTDSLELIVHDLRLRQLDVLCAEIPDAFSDHVTRMSSAMAAGLAIVNDLAEVQPNLRDLMTQIVVLAEHDARLAFLKAIPEGPVLSMMRATALEQAIFGSESRDVAELALLIGLFTVLLDGLLDEVPEFLQPVKPWLDRIMTLQHLAERPPPGVHPVADAVAWAASEAIRRLPGLPGWHDPIARAEFKRATSAAYATELASISCRITDRRLSPDEQRSRILNKSAACIWAGALIPFIVHGWPNGINARTFESLARAIGAFGGWIDDIVDLAVDLKADRWSMPLFEVFDMVSSVDARAVSGGDFRATLAESLQHPFIGGRLPAMGVERLNRVRMCLGDLGIPEERILPVMADVARACLLDCLVPA